MEEKKVVKLETEVEVEKKSLKQKTVEWWNQKGKKTVVMVGKVVGGAVLLAGCAIVGMALAENVNKSDVEKVLGIEDDTVKDVPFEEVPDEVPEEVAE